MDVITEELIRVLKRNTSENKNIIDILMSSV